MFWQLFSFSIKVMSKFSLNEFLTSAQRAFVRMTQKKKKKKKNHQQVFSFISYYYYFVFRSYIFWP